MWHWLMRLGVAWLLWRGWRWRRWRASAENPRTWKSLDYVHERVTKELEAQSKDWDDIDGRLRLILGVIGIVFAAALGFQRAQTQIPFIVGFLTLLAILAFLLAAGLVAVVYRPMDLDRPPKPSSLRQRYLLRAPEESKLAVIDSIIEAYNSNVAIIDRKTRVFIWAFWISAGATVLMGVAIMLQVAVQTTDILAPTPTPVVSPTAPSPTLQRSEPGAS